MKSAPRFPASFALFGLASSCAFGQSYTPMKDLPGGALVARMQSALGGIGDGGTVGEIRWDAAANRLWFEREGWKTVDLATGAVADADGEPPADAVAAAGRRNGRGERRPARGRQFTTADSPDGAWKAVSDGGNLFLEPKDGDRIALTQDGSTDIKYGQASWVYGEELDQTTAMWWSPDSRYLAFYRFDESKVPDFFILGGWTDRNTRVVSEAYPKPGQPNPTARILVHDLKEKRTVELDTVSADSGAVEGAEYYIFNVRWTPDGSEILYSRTPRRQDVLEVMAADPATGASRLVVREEQEAWQDNRPEMRFLADGRRFLWETEKSGFKQYELRSLDGALLATLTDDSTPAEAIVSVDEDAGEVWYTAWSGPVAVQQQLHVAKLDGSGWVRVTTGEFHHTNFRIAPGGGAVVATAQTTQVPPHDVVYGVPVGAGTGRRGPGRLLAKLGEGGTKGFETHRLTPSELFTCMAADGRTTLYGKLHFPPAFDPARKYPLVVETYGGPTVRLVTDSFTPGDAKTALGFILMTVDNRGTPGRGKAFETAAYMNLGVVDADDQAAAVEHLAATRPYIDGTRVGITGHSYGGYMSAICLIRRGDVFAAGVAGAPPTDWRQYDTIYTERYMRTPEENPEGYDAGSCVKQAGKLQGQLLLLHGMIDDNVHPNNTFELAHALQSINRPFSMMLFPNSEHGIWSPAVESVKWSFFVEALRPEVPEWGGKPQAKEGAAS